MSKILVTGANGFVGNALSESLHAREIDFVPVVRQVSRPGQLAIGDMNAKTKWKNHLSGCDAVIHLAARVHVMHDHSRTPLSAFRAVNVDATLNLAKQAALCGVKRFVFVSSVKVNGEETTGKAFSGFDVPAPIDAYGISKLEAEQVLMALSDATGMELVIVRPPLVYGPGVRANFLRLMQFVKMGVPLPLGAIHNRRSMVALDNLVDLLIACSHHQAAPGNIFMVADDKDVSISELICLLAAAMGKRPRLLPLPAGVIAMAAALFGQSKVARRLLGSLQVDTAHVKAVLGWRPVVSMQQALDKTVAHFMAGQ